MASSRRTEWFRRTTWTTEDRTEFFARLGRSRSLFHKAQYLRIQAYTLGEAGKSDTALELLNLLVADYPDQSQLALAHEHRGSILRTRDSIPAAIEAFAAGQRAEREFPTMHTRCSLLLALVIVEERMVKRYEEARAAVDFYVSRNAEMPFPIDAYRVNVVRAALAKQDRQDAKAKVHAEAALAAGIAKASAFTRHPKLGLVGSATSKLHSWLRRWSSS